MGARLLKNVAVALRCPSPPPQTYFHCTFSLVRHFCHVDLKPLRFQLGYYTSNAAAAAAAEEFVATTNTLSRQIRKTRGY